MSRGAARFGFVMVLLGVSAMPAHAATPKEAVAARDTAQVVLPEKRPEEVRVEPLTVAQGAGAAAPLVRPAPTGGTSIRIKAGEQLVIRDAAEAAPKPISLDTSQKSNMAPTLAVGVRDPQKGTVARQFRPFLRATISPLRWDAAAGSYATTIVVGLDPVAGDEDAASLEFPEPVAFHLDAVNADKLDPPLIKVSHAGVEGYQRFTVQTRQFERAVHVNARSKFGDRTYEASIEPGPSFLEVGRSAERVDGFGLGRVTISVRRLAANQQPWPFAAESRVHLQTTAGHLEPDHVVLGAQSAVGETFLISDAWGTATISSTTASTSNKATVDFAFPTLKFLLGLFGAACAGALRVLTVKREKREKWTTVFIGCVASGITVDILLALGAPIAPDWLLALIRSELAWFAVGLIAGYPGISVVARLGEKWFASKSEEAPTTA